MVHPYTLSALNRCFVQSPSKKEDAREIPGELLTGFQRGNSLFYPPAPPSLQGAHRFLLRPFNVSGFPMKQLFCFLFFTSGFFAPPFFGLHIYYAGKKNKAKNQTHKKRSLFSYQVCNGTCAVYIHVFSNYSTCQFASGCLTTARRLLLHFNCLWRTEKRKLVD